VLRINASGALTDPPTPTIQNKNTPFGVFLVLVGVGGNLTLTIGRNEMVSDTHIFERKQAFLILLSPKFNQFSLEMPNTCTALL